MPTDTPLHKAAHNGDMAQVKNLIEAGEIDVNQAGAAERRPLHRAAGGNHAGVVSYLLDNGATVDQTDKSGRTALHWAAISGHKDASDLLLKAGANLFATTNSGMSPLHGAAEGGRAELVRFFLEQVPADRKEELCNAKDGDGKTAFELAMGGGHKAVCKIMKELGDPNAASAACVIS